VFFVVWLGLYVAGRESHTGILCLGWLLVAGLYFERWQFFKIIKRQDQELKRLRKTAGEDSRWK